MRTNLHKIVAFLLVSLVGLSAFTASAADKFEVGTKVYLKPNSNWTQSNAWFAAYFFTGSTADGWQAMSDTNCDGVYEVEYALTGKTSTGVIFCRMDPAKTALEWGSVWNQTKDITNYSKSKNTYTIASGAWSNGNGSWSQVAYDFYVAGNGKNNAPWCDGKEWDNKGSKLDADGSVTFSGVKAGTYEFKVTNGTWDVTFGSGSIDANNSTKNDCRFKDLGEGSDGNVKFTISEAADITIKYEGCKIIVTADFLAPIEEYYVLMGVDGDWTNGIELKPNPSNSNEMMLLGQTISKANDAIKVVKKTPCEDEFYAAVSAATTVPYTGGGSGSGVSNIVLEDGTYDFYFDITTGQIRIEGELTNSNSVYLDPQVYDNQYPGTWMSDNARIAVYCYQSAGTDNVWVTASYCNGDYYAQIPTMYDKYIWCRMDPAKENNWDGDWNQTSGIQYDAENTLTKLTGWANDDPTVHYQTKYTGICGVNYDD
ncbi:MAG: hypothetical protein J6V62_02580, partial [Paludibacteraceae bacterium]|nr:hypothetical protein [Paludibacteraceae bacterium]